jgi:hypothetical protein
MDNPERYASSLWHAGFRRISASIADSGEVDYSPRPRSDNPMNNDMQRRALAVRDAHEALLDLKRVVEEATRTTHCVELEAVHLAVRSSKTGDISSRLRSVLERLGSSDF